MTSRSRIFFLAPFLAAMLAAIPAARALELTVCTTLLRLENRVDYCAGAPMPALCAADQAFPVRLRGARVEFFEASSRRVLASSAIFKRSDRALTCHTFDYSRANNEPRYPHIGLRYKFQVRNTKNLGVTARVPPFVALGSAAGFDPANPPNDNELGFLEWSQETNVLWTGATCGRGTIQQEIDLKYVGLANLKATLGSMGTNPVAPGVLSSRGCILGLQPVPDQTPARFPIVGIMFPWDSPRGAVSGVLPEFLPRPDSPNPFLNVARNIAATSRASVAASLLDFLEKYGDRAEWDSDPLTHPGHTGAARWQKTFWFLPGSGGINRESALHSSENTEYAATVPVEPYVIEYDYRDLTRLGPPRALAMEFVRSMQARKFDQFPGHNTCVGAIGASIDFRRSVTKAMSLGCATQRAFATFIAATAFWDPVNAAVNPVFIKRRNENDSTKTIFFNEPMNDPKKPHYLKTDYYYPPDAYTGQPITADHEYHYGGVFQGDVQPSMVIPEAGIAHAELQIAKALWDLADKQGEGSVTGTLSKAHCTGWDEEAEVPVNVIIRAIALLRGFTDEPDPVSDPWAENEFLLRAGMTLSSSGCEDYYNVGGYEQPCENTCSAMACVAGEIGKIIGSHIPAQESQRITDYPSLIDLRNILLHALGPSAVIGADAENSAEALFRGRCTYPKQAEFPYPWINPLADPPNQVAWAQSLGAVFDACFPESIGGWAANPPHFISGDAINNIARTVVDHEPDPNDPDANCPLLRCHADRSGPLEFCSPPDPSIPVQGFNWQDGCYLSDAELGIDERGVLQQTYGTLACPNFGGQ